MAQSLSSSEPAAAVKLATEATNLNPFVAQPWHILVEHYRQGNLPERDMGKLLNTLFKKAKDHPDLTLSILTKYLAHYDRDDTKRRQQLYNVAYKIYQRPLLAIHSHARTYKFNCAGPKCRNFSKMKNQTSQPS